MLRSIVFLLSATFATNATVVLLFPKGFSIEVDGGRARINNAKFEVSVTRNDGRLIVANYSEVVTPFFRNKRNFYKRNIMLNVNDIISYKITTNSNNSTMIIEEGVCVVKELPMMGKLRKNDWMYTYDITLTKSECGGSVAVDDPATAPTLVQRVSEEDSALKLRKCEETVFNHSISRLALQIEVEELRNLTKQIKDFEESFPLAKQLTLSGRIPPVGDAVETVRFMLSEKLDLKPVIESAFREGPYSIRFTVSTIIEKLQILEVAKFVLAGSKIQIS